MSLVGESFLSSEQLSNKDIEKIFSRASLFKAEFSRKKRFDHCLLEDPNTQRVVAMVFSEPSTRTRMSFQIACARMGFHTTALDNPASTSQVKGETLEDTLRTISAMRPDLMVVRYNTNPTADACLKELSCPVISGGIGSDEHPTQALLDAFTINEFRGSVKGERVLIVGDVLHSRVANSNLSLLTKMGAEVAYCSPNELSPQKENWRGVRSFAKLKDGVSWATAVMALRIQKERHGRNDDASIGLTVAEYREQYRFGNDQLKHLIPDGILLHPGPVIRGIEYSDYVLSDKRCKVLDQVTNGVFLRAALMSIILGIEVQTP